MIHDTLGKVGGAWRGRVWALGGVMFCYMRV